MYSRANQIIEEVVIKHKIATRREERKLLEAKIEGMCEVLTCMGVFSQLDVKNIQNKISNRTGQKNNNG